MVGARLRGIGVVGGRTQIELKLRSANLEILKTPLCNIFKLFEKKWVVYFFEASIIMRRYASLVRTCFVANNRKLKICSNRGG